MLRFERCVDLIDDGETGGNALVGIERAIEIGEVLSEGETKQ